MYALWFYLGTLTGAFGFMDLGIGVAVGRYMGVAIGEGDNQASREYWSTGNIISFFLVAFFAIVFVVLGTSLAPAWFKVSGDDAATLRLAILTGGIGLFFSYYGQMWFVLSATHLDFRFISLMRTTLSFVTIIGSVIVAMVWKNVACLAAFTSLVGAAQFYLLVRRGNAHYGMPVSFSQFKISRFKKMYSYILKTFIQILSNSLVGSLDKILLGRLAPIAEFTSYNVSLNVASRFQGISQAVMGPVLANSSRGVGGDSDNSPRVIYGEFFVMLAPMYIFFVLWIFSWNEPLLDLWLGSERGGLTSLSFPWVVAALSISAVANISTAQLASLDRVGTGLLLSFTQNLLSAGLVYIGWHFDGLRGASVGLLLSRMPTFVQDWIVRSIVGFKFGFRELRPIVLSTTCGVLSMGIASIATHFHTSTGLKTLLALLAAAIGGLVILLEIFRSWKQSNHALT